MTDGADTIRAVMAALDKAEYLHNEPRYYGLPADTELVARIAIEADRQSLIEQGYVIVKRESLVAARMRQR